MLARFYRGYSRTPHAGLARPTANFHCPCRGRVGQRAENLATAKAHNLRVRRISGPPFANGRDYFAPASEFLIASLTVFTPSFGTFLGASTPSFGNSFA